MKKELIVKHNKIIEGKYNMTTTEIKIIAKLTSLIGKNDEDFKEHIFISKNLLNELNLGSQNYTALEESINKLISRRIEIEQENQKKKLVTTFLSSCIYDNSGDESKIILRYDPNLKPYFIQLGNHFTKYYLENVLELNSFYAIRIYELCKQYENTKQKYRILELKELKELLDVTEKSYNRYDNFKRRIILKAQEEINEKTDINISFEEIKTGRKVTSIKFKIKSKIKKSNYEKELEEKIRKQNKKLNENTFVSDEKIDFENLSEKEKEFLQKARLIAKKES